MAGQPRIMQLQIRTRGHPEFDLFSTRSITAGKTSVALADDVVAVSQGAIVRRSLDLPNVLEVAISFGVGVSSTVAANAVWAWLVRGLKQRPQRIEIDHRAVEFEEGVIKRYVEERIRSDAS